MYIKAYQVIEKQQQIDQSIRPEPNITPQRSHHMIRNSQNKDSNNFVKSLLSFRHYRKRNQNIDLEMEEGMKIREQNNSYEKLKINQRNARLKTRKRNSKKQEIPQSVKQQVMKIIQEKNCQTHNNTNNSNNTYRASSNQKSRKVAIGKNVFVEGVQAIINFNNTNNKELLGTKNTETSPKKYVLDLSLKNTPIKLSRDWQTPITQKKKQSNNIQYCINFRTFKKQNKLRNIGAEQPPIVKQYRKLMTSKCMRTSRNIHSPKLASQSSRKSLKNRSFSLNNALYQDSSKMLNEHLNPWIVSGVDDEEINF